jgi:hypothetical protein
MAMVALAIGGIILTLAWSVPHHWSSAAKTDYVTYWLAGRLAAHGANPYDSHALASALYEISGRHAQTFFSYPPHALLLFAPLSLVPLQASYWVYQLLGVGMFLFAARAYAPTWLAIVGLLSPAAIISVFFGQSGLLYAALWMLAFSGSASAVAALTFRPQLGMLAGIQAWRSGLFMRAIVLGLGIVLVTTLVFGPGVWPAWIDELRDHARFVNRDFIFYRQMAVPLFGYGFAGWVLFGGTAAYFLWRSFNVFTAGTAALLISPHGLHYDMVMVCFGCAVVLHSRWHQAKPLQRIALGLGFLSPGLVYFGTWLVPPILLVALSEQAALTRTQPVDSIK